VDEATDGGPVLDDDASISDSGLPDAPDVSPSAVTVMCHELELAINDAGATLRWYGGVVSEATPRTEVTVDGMRWLRDGRTPGALVPGQRAKDTPLIQHEVLFELEPAPEEAALCDAAPALIRGFETERVELEVTGTSAEGPWVGTCSVPADEVFVTCHSGSSRVAHAMAGNYPANVAIGQPEPYGDATVTVYTREPLAAGFTVLELWVAADAGTVRHDLDLAGIAHTQVSPEVRVPACSGTGCRTRRSSARARRRSRATSRWAIACRAAGPSCRECRSRESAKDLLRGIAPSAVDSHRVVVGYECLRVDFVDPAPSRRARPSFACREHMRRAQQRIPPCDSP
jgi:hypothetical protein